jgi:threonine/homoserine/homoserine lactone efflux protein
MFVVPLEFLAAALLIELTPGPNMAYLALLSAQRGRRAGFAAVYGVTVGLVLCAALTIFGLSTILLDDGLMLIALNAAGACFMIYLAWEAWELGHSNAPTTSQPSAQGPFVRGLLANLLNAKAALFYAFLLPRFTDPTGGPVWLQALGLAAQHIAIATAIHCGIVLGASRAHRIVGHAASDPRVRAAFALALICTAFWLALS